MGLIRRDQAYGDRFVPARPGRELTDAERSVLQASLGAGADMMTHRQQTHHAGSTDNAITLAVGSLIYSGAIALAAALITAGVVFLAYMTLGGDGGRWAVVWLVLWGLGVLAALLWNRRQGLYHSPAGLAHHEIDSRERVALETMHRHADIIERRLELEQGRSDVKYIEG